MTAPRISPGRRSDVGLIAWTVSRLSGRFTGTGPPNLFLTLGRRPALFVGWLIFASRLMPGGKLPRRETELVILRVANLTGCDYERTHHERLGRRAGLTDAEIDRAGQAADDPAWSARDRALLVAVDRLQTSRDLDDASYAELRAQLSEAEIVEFLMLVGHYQMLAQFLTTLRIEPDAVR